jgi:hypothetical protein
MPKLKRLTLTEELIAQISLAARATDLASHGRISHMRADMERVDLADAIVAAYTEQSTDRTRQLPARATALAPAVDVCIAPKRRRRA